VKRVACYALALLACAIGTAAQESLTLRGKVWAGNGPVAGQPVALHRVTAAGGQTISADTTAEDGSFSLTLDTLNAEGVNFVATRYQGKLYIGDTFRGELPVEYVLRVGPGATPLDFGPAATSTPVAPARQSQTAGFIIILGAVIALIGLIALGARRRAPPLRQLLVEIADLDNRHEVAPIPQYAQQREELLRRLRESA
jgi:hypothetical protein